MLCGLTFLHQRLERSWIWVVARGPEGYEIEQQRTPSAQEIDEIVSEQSFVSLSHRVIHQLFASSYVEYFDKISRRALSALAVISDEAFHRGLPEFQEWANLQPRDVAVCEPVDLFIFQKSAAEVRLGS